jgi:hypothetical protein
MPTETLICQQCGSADVQEVKPNTYFCNHCDAVFKHVTPSSTAVAGCEINGCGIAAIRRCSSCGLAFCASHQAGVDGCTACMQRQGDTLEAAMTKLRDEWVASARPIIDTVQDPIARLVMVVGCLGRMHLSEEHAAARALIPEIWPDELQPDPAKRPWNNDDIQRWFLRAVKGSPPDQVPMREWQDGTFAFLKSSRQRMREWAEPGWSFEHGSTLAPFGNRHLYGDATVSILPDGRRIPQEAGFNPIALGCMAELAELPALPLWQTTLPSRI